MQGWIRLVSVKIGVNRIAIPAFVSLKAKEPYLCFSCFESLTSENRMKIKPWFFAMLSAWSAFSCVSQKTHAPIRVACVGDSITYGRGIEEREQNSYPAQLGDCLGSGWFVENFGVNSATLLSQGGKPYRDQPAFLQVCAFKPDVIVIMLGTNDTKQEDWQKHHGEFVSDYMALIRSFRESSASTRIYLCKPVPIFRDRGKAWDTDKVLAEEICPAIDEVARQMHATVIDLHTLLEGDAAMFADGVHPNAVGAAIMARAICQSLEKGK